MVNYSILLCFDSMLSYNTSVQNDIIMTTAKQNQKFPFHFFFRFAVEGWGEETREKCKEIFWFLHTRVRERVRGALYRFTAQSERTERFRATTRVARAISRHSDCFGKKFGFCSGDTAKLQNSFFRQNAERRKATRRGFPPELPKGF